MKQHCLNFLHVYVNLLSKVTQFVLFGFAKSWLFITIKGVDVNKRTATTTFKNTHSIMSNLKLGQDVVNKGERKYTATHTV